VSFLEVGVSSLQAITFEKSVGLCIRCILDNAPQGVGEAGEADHFEVLSIYVDKSKQVNMHFSSPRTQYRIGMYDCLGRLVSFTNFTAVAGNNSGKPMFRVFRRECISSISRTAKASLQRNGS